MKADRKHYIEDALDTVLMALDILECLKKRNQQPGITNVDVRIGIHTGRVPCVANM